MAEEDQVLDLLADRGVLEALLWAHGSAYGQVRQDFNPEGGQKQGWIGYNAYTYLVDRLDRVFQCGDYQAPSGEGPVGRDVLAAGISDFATMPDLAPGTVVRHDLNGSPGWMVDGWRWLLASYPFGQVTKIRWTDKSETKQTVARQPHNTDDGGLFTIEDVAGLPRLEELGDHEQLLRNTLVLAHAMDSNTVDFELFLGRIRWNQDRGDAWVWRSDLLDRQTPPPAGRTTPKLPDNPVPPSSTEANDAPVSIRRLPNDSSAPRAIGEA
ncbi:hypothetical protein FFT09_19020 [Saccharomonospora piscinae]|uniref:hypothetical protein n=1 Tax=Saccharomonospora piscinae TaxID=687388 RepID=UPI001106A5AB|nr:hypothetical protein [Saccharomonospora piscinae]TLW91336.1 hypothetical protein FFT09_19020 [Saccharomonospora piscinae]